MTTLAPRSSSSEVAIRGEGLTLDQVVAVARHRVPVALSREAVAPMADSRAYVERMLAEDQVVYGVTTGFGQFKDVHIGDEAVETLQRNLILSHSAGTGEPLAVEEVRAIMLLRANALAKGFSGVRRDVVDLLLAMLNRGVHPVVPCQGSVGASGDLAPLAHLALGLIGEGCCEHRGEVLPAREALAATGLTPIRLAAKEGLALINGTQVMTGIGALAWQRAVRLAALADVACAMTLEATLGSRRAFMSQLHRLRPHPGQLATARNLTVLTEGSKLMESHRDCGRVQDAYSLRCAPQVHGASRDAIAYVERVLEVEINSANDNPLIFADQEEVINGGNFHGQPVALAMDFLAIALAELADIGERRIERLVNPALSNGLPAFLAVNGGLNSGYMVAQYTAAALVSENKVLAHPACVDSIPTSANQEDHVSMGTIGARKARRVLEHAETVLAIELMCAAQGLDFRTPVPPAPAVAAAHRAVREVVPALTEDRLVAADLERLVAVVREGGILGEVEAIAGPLS